VSFTCLDPSAGPIWTGDKGDKSSVLIFTHDDDLAAYSFYSDASFLVNKLLL